MLAVSGHWLGPSSLLITPSQVPCPIYLATVIPLVWISVCLGPGPSVGVGLLRPQQPP